MMNRIKGLVSKIKISDRVFAFALLICLGIALLPLLRLGLYTAPFYDDYGYGERVKHIVMAGGGLKDVISGVIYNARGYWYAWQGTYSSIAFMSLMPAAFGEQYYFIGSWIMILSLSGSAFLFTFVMCSTFLKADRSNCIAMSSITSLFLVELIHTAHQGFYWYNGSVHYVFMYANFLFMATAMIKLLYSRTNLGLIVSLIITTMLALIVAGANFVVALQGILLIALMCGVAVITRNKRGLYLILPAILYMYGMRKNIIAPGNSKREAFYTGYSAVKSVAYSFVNGIKFIPVFTGLITICVMIAIIPLAWNLVKDTEYSYRLPGVVTILSFCFYATGFTPSLYAMANPGLDRTLNVVKFTFQILLVINEIYWIGWIINRLKDKGCNIKNLSHNLVFYAACVLLVMIVFATSKNQAGSFSSYGAYYYVHSGEAANYRNEYLLSIEEIEHNVGGDVTIKQHMFRPWLLCGNNEISEDPSAEQNVMMARFYDVNSIRSEKLE